jgi:ubiquinone/menaquinone biosynthesis C-methylase UbiE
MSDQHARSFGGVADSYDRGRPTYPREAAAWLVGEDPVTVLELGAGTGKFTAVLAELGHDVHATDPDEQMLERLRAKLPDVRTSVASAEEIPAPDASYDVVVVAQAFHWFDLDRALPEIARVLRPGGHLALVWNLRDDRVPWVRRLGTLIGTQEQQNDPTHALLSSHLFGFVESATYRFWQPLDRSRLRDLVVSRSNVALMSEPEREQLLRKVDDLYEEYGRGADGMLLPYVTHCYRAVVRPPALVDDDRPSRHDDGDSDALLIDFS